MKNLFKRLGEFLGVNEPAVVAPVVEEKPKHKATAKKPVAKKTTAAKKTTSAPKHKK